MNLLNPERLHNTLLSVTNKKKLTTSMNTAISFSRQPSAAPHWAETFEKCSFLFKFKEGEDFNHRNTLSILRIKI